MQKENNKIEPAQRVKQVEEYYFSVRLKTVAQMNAQGKDVINLGIGSPDLPPSQETIQTLCANAIKADAHGYQPYTGIKELRESYAEWYKRWYNVQVNPGTEVLPLIGSKEGVLHISLAFLNPGDKALIPNPGYPTYTSVTNLIGAHPMPYTLKEDHQWQPDFKALEDTDTTGVKLMWTNYPNMPTGAKGNIELYQRLVDFGKKRNIIIVNDNPYSFILNQKPESIMSVPGAKDTCIELNSLSKSHNMPGWRMGMLISNPHFVQWILKVKSNIDSGQFKPMQQAAIQALRSTKEYHEEMNKTYRTRRALAGKIMNALRCTYDDHQVGLFLWGKLPENIPSSESLADKILHEARVFITPGFIFGTAGSRYIRLSLCCPEDTLQEALQRIESIMKQ